MKGGRWIKRKEKPKKENEREEGKREAWRRSREGLH